MKKILMKMITTISSLISSLRLSYKIMVAILLLFIGDIGFQYCIGNTVSAIKEINIVIILVLIFSFIIAHDMIY